MAQNMEMAIATLTDESILQAFADDHERLGEILSRTIKACQEAATREAQASFYTYEDRLRLHIRAEDEVLFPAFEAHSGLRDHGPTVVMRREHREIERRLDQISAEFDGAPALDRIERRLLALQALLMDHDRREERALYPACDRFFSRGKRLASVHALLEGGG